MVFGMFMAILDIQIVSASLAEIQAGLSASADEISWVQTAYLIAEVIMIPLSGFLSRACRRAVLFAVSAAGFTVASALCATATNMDQMIVYRAMQGFIGGGMIPSVFAAAFTIFPRVASAPIVSPMIGLVATLAPTIGPTVGGYLTELFSWHWLFLVNVVPGIAGHHRRAGSLIDFDKPNLELLERFDWWGLPAWRRSSAPRIRAGGRAATMTGCRTTACFICRGHHGTSARCVLLARAHRRGADRRPARLQQPQFRLRLAVLFVLGIGLYGLTYLYPRLSRAGPRLLRRCMIGETMFVTRRLRCSSPRRSPACCRARWTRALMLMIGFFGFAAGTWLDDRHHRTGISGELLVPQVLRGVSLMLCMVPINNIALGTLPPDALKNASGPVQPHPQPRRRGRPGVINTVLNERMDLHLVRLREHVTWSSQTALETLRNLQNAMAPLGSDADLAGLRKLAGIVRLQAQVMAFADAFVLLTGMFLATACMVFLLKKPAPPKPGAAGGGGH